MRKASAFAALLLLLGVLALGQQPRAQLTATGVGGGGFGGAGVSTCVSLGYVGPGDVAGAGSALLWGGLRSYTAALCGNALANVCNSTGGTDVGCADMFSSTTTGALVSATVGGITCPGANCTVKTLYDQTLGSHCTGSCDLTQATIAQRPTLAAACSGLTTYPCMQPSSSGTPFMIAAGSMTLPQPWSMAATSVRTSAGPNGGILTSIGFTGEVGGTTTANFAYAACDFSIGSTSGSVADGTWHNLLGTCSGATVFLYANGALLNTTGSVGATTLSGAPFILYVNGDAVQAVEFGFYGSSLNAVTAALSANQRSFYGF